MIDVSTERVKYGRMHQIPGYSSGPGASYVAHLLPYLKPGDSIIDFGCGDGEAGRAFSHFGYRVTLIDITSSGLSSKNGVRFIEASLHDLPFDIPPARWGFCTDVMEHLPEEWVSPALTGMRRLVGNIFFSISGVPDGWGKYIGESLHLTVKPAEWWIEEIRKCWQRVKRLNESDNIYEVMGQT